MKHRTITAALAATATATLVVGSATLAAAATNTESVRPGDLIAGLSDTRSAGSVSFLREGVRVITTDNTSNAKAAEYFALSGGIPANGSYDWTGTSNQPGSQIVFDTDGDRTNANSFNVLVGEQVYSTNGRGQDLTDWWYTGGTTRAAQRGITCPSTTGGSGSDCHGSLADWQASLATTHPATQVYAGGFSLGSGVQGEGVLRSLTFGDTEYVFTSDPETPAPVIDDVSPEAGQVAVKNRRAVVTMSSEDQPDGVTQRGDKLVWTVTVDGTVEFTTTQDYSETDTYKVSFDKGSGKHKVVLLANGQRYDAGTVNARR